MRFAVAALLTIPGLFALLFAPSAGWQQEHALLYDSLFFLDFGAMFALAIAGIVRAFVSESGMTRVFVFLFSLPSLAFGIGLAFLIYFYSHLKFDGM